MSLNSGRSRRLIIGIAALLSIIVVSATIHEYYPFTDGSTSSSASSTITTSTSIVSTSTTLATTSTYPTPREACANLPQTAIGTYTADPNASSVYILIVEADIGSPYEGINGSAFHQNTNWPVITVYQGQRVTMHVVNCPSSPEPHGFAIGHYFPNGVELSPNQQYTLTFVASTKGRFTVFCNVYCAIHQLMQNGELLVK